MTRLFTNYKIRINLLSIIFSLFSLIILIKTFYIQAFVAASYREQTTVAGMHKKSVEGLRGNIYDKNRNILAETIQSYTFWVNTYKDIDRNKIIKLFSKTFNKPEEYYSQLLIDNKNYIALENKVIKSKCLNVLNQIKSIKGLY